MASATITYERKRSLLGSLGSRRRQKHLVDSLPVKKPEPLIMSIPAFIETPRRNARGRNDQHSDSIEEMASRLLDDSSSSFQIQDRMRLSHDGPAHGAALDSVASRRNTLELIGTAAVAPLTLSPLIERPGASPDTRSRAPRVGKYSPKVSGKGLKRASTTRAQQDPSIKRKDSGLLRPLPQSQILTLDPFKLHPTTGLKASSSVPLRAVDGNIGNRRPETQNTSAPGGHDGAEEINQKVHAMLAATNALKPSPAQATNSSTSKFTRMVPSKVFAKVSNVLERLHSKPSLQDTRGGKAMPSLDGEEHQVLTKPDTPMHSPTSANMSPISTIEIRLNEGHNLNKKKVQKIVGGQVVRKPVADDGKSLRSGKSMEDPFSELGKSRSPTPFESRLKLEAEIESGAIPPIPRNPFESEKGFDNDIEDRILSTTPVGSSTPRTRVERVSTSSSERSPTTRLSRSTKAQVDLMLDGVALRLGTGELTGAQPMGLAATRANQRTLADPVRRTRQTSIGTVQGLDVSGLKRMKKHPSPSKEALEDLKMAFRKYADLKVTGAKQDELDELASSFLSSPLSLTPREKNRFISCRLSASNINELSSPGGRRCHSRRVSAAAAVPVSRLPRPAENSLKLRAEIRLAPAYRPAFVHANDVDELH
ncbi:Fc.00g100540.m01.CDS01 [Cosmosporella sp. VM-42]